MDKMNWLQSRRKLLLGRNRYNLSMKKQDYTVNSHHKFDESTGQVYTENTLSIQNSDDQYWARQTKVVIGPEYRDSEDNVSFSEASGESRDSEASLGAYHDYLNELKNTRIRGLKGARSLQDCAVDCILENISDVTFEGIACLPITLVRRIWHAVNKRCLLSFHTWMIFSKVLRNGDLPTLSLFRYRQAIETPLSPLHVYSEPLTSHSFDFITSLSINTVSTVPELVKLSSITNLGILEIIHDVCSDSYRSPPPSLVSDRLIRAWHFAALNEGKFRVLRIMKLWNHTEVTNKSLPYLNSFPALALFDVRGCGFSPEAKTDAKRLGWRATLEPNILASLEAACVERAMILQQSLGVEPKPLRRPSARQLSDGSKIRLIPRSEVASFLVRPETVIPGEPLVDDKEYTRIRQELSSSKSCKKHAKGRRFDLMDNYLHRGSRALETWEFILYTSFSRIGELRNDIDLIKSGVAVQDSAVLVGNELVAPLPMVSLQLGTSKNFPSLIESAHKPFYKGLEEDVSSLKFAREQATVRGGRYLAFTRIKVPKDDKDTKTQDGSLGGDANAHSDFVAPSAPSQAGPAKRRKVGVMKSKKINLGDVLDSFR